ncbi:glycogen debranching protein GlgX [Cellulomonas chengniuliangii]|uniref:Glycogen debranching protein GlgX n=1 Tax=Cellulomonas chengniuliangii TaxID=2968084 RepID=A0ABY5L496_9CELL|nr:glycogen debranching protein GlgX [Cellulomonas chengniuliangii]MCC2309840.1 glycogen debranching protein GlgX [Cellulomonas chengniuliangii]MCC2318099.1 glycogen debranching protein GlgX [Cellulomonas chengniuliangii]UUI76285.1 glycogen debranching protein GlgX [Cellulomonas chengniuliangii]
MPDLGVRVTDAGIEAAVLASHASAVDLCLLDPGPPGPDGPTWVERRIAMRGPHLGVFWVEAPGVRPGQHYGFRAHGEWDPAGGLRYNPAKLLVDPYARGLDGDLELRPEVFGQVVDDELQGDPYGPADGRDSAAHVPHSVVVDTRAHGGAPAPAANRPRTPWSRTVVYEAHVRGLTQQMPDLPEALRGTYAGLAHPATIGHLRALGVTALELLPVHASASEPHLSRHGLSNYWGYNTLGFFAPHAAYATREAQAQGPAAVLAEVKAAVRALHAAGIEVLLDVVLNHTCEGGIGGPQIGWRGLDPSVYYAHDGGYPARLADFTGTGNALDFRRTPVIRMALDSLRYWADEVGVDGFRFDLAVTLGRGPAGFDPHHPFLVALTTDPSLRDLKLIAEPWDVGPGGWQTGQFPPPFAEWNDKFRDAVRSFWLADPGRAAHGLPGHRVRELATRLAGSADLFGHTDPPLMRGPLASVNYVTAHDGFTMADLVAYDHKHNSANCEDNRDGTNDNRSWNHGVEGPLEGDSIAAPILPLRRRSIRNLFAMLLLSAGTPMITAGDEMGRTQRGNNNAYCQDNETSWVSWELSPWRADLLATVRHLLRLRREHPALRSQRFFTGSPAAPGARPDLAWYGPDGVALDHGRWHDPDIRTLQMVRSLPSEGGPAGQGGAEPADDTVMLLVNGALDQVEVVLAADRPTVWELAWDSTWESPRELRAAAMSSALRTPSGDRTVMAPLSTRVYIAR